MLQGSGVRGVSEVRGEGCLGSVVRGGEGFRG